MNLRPALLAALLCGPLAAAEPELAFKDAKKEQVRHSMLGPRDTVLFYTFAEQAAVLVVNIAGKEPFAASATVHLFAPGTTAEALAKWVNNRHSDGLFPDVPEPSSSVKLPDGTAAVTGSEPVGKEQHPDGESVFADYKVKLTVKEHREPGKFHLPAFEDEANVFVKIEGD
jgi:hypothetical protein